MQLAASEAEIQAACLDWLCTLPGCIRSDGVIKNPYNSTRQEERQS